MGTVVVVASSLIAAGAQDAQVAGLVAASRRPRQDVVDLRADHVGHVMTARSAMKAIAAGDADPHDERDRLALTSADDRVPLVMLVEAVQPLAQHGRDVHRGLHAPTAEGDHMTEDRRA